MTSRYLPYCQKPCSVLLRVIFGWKSSDSYCADSLNHAVFFSNLSKGWKIKETLGPPPNNASPPLILHKDMITTEYLSFTKIDLPYCEGIFKFVILLNRKVT